MTPKRLGGFVNHVRRTFAMAAGLVQSSPEISKFVGVMEIIMENSVKLMVKLLL